MVETTNKDINGEDCPLGLECPIHYRYDREDVSEEMEYIRIVTYVDEFVVITDDNPEMTTPSAMLAAILGGRDLPDPYEIVVIHVGDKALADLRDLPRKERAESVRWAQTHDNWAGVRDAHAMVVNSVKEKSIDLSKMADFDV